MLPRRASIPSTVTPAHEENRRADINHARKSSRESTRVDVTPFADDASLEEAAMVQLLSSRAQYRPNAEVSRQCLLMKRSENASACGSESADLKAISS